MVRFVTRDYAPVNLLNPSGLQNIINEFGEDYWNRVAAQFQRRNDFLPGKFASPLTSIPSGTSSWLAKRTGVPSIMQWLGQALINKSFPQGILNGMVLSRLATVGLSLGSTATGIIAVGVAYEAGLFFGSMISAYIWDYGNPKSPNNNCP